MQAGDAVELLNRSGFLARRLSGVRALKPGEWDDLFPRDVEGANYYSACEAAPPPAFTFQAIGVYRDERLVCAAPTFKLVYRLDTPLQGNWRKFGDRLANTFPRYIKLPVLGIGSPLADRAHIGLAPDLAPTEKAEAASVLLEALEHMAALDGIEIIAIKDLADNDLPPLLGALATQHFTRVGSLPVAVLDLSPFANEDAYLASLSPATRKDIRRKLKGASRIRVEERGDISDIEEKIVALYDSTRSQSGVDYGDFEKLSPEYFNGVVKQLGNRAVTFLYWLDDDLIGFNLCFVENGQMIDKFIGMTYPVAREHNLYVLSWMTNVRYCLQHGIKLMQTGQTAYASKLRFGSRLDKLWLCFKHRRPFWNWIFAKAGTLIAFDKLDPDLAALATKTKNNHQDPPRQT